MAMWRSRKPVYLAPVGLAAAAALIGGCGSDGSLNPGTSTTGDIFTSGTGGSASSTTGTGGGTTSAPTTNGGTGFTTGMDGPMTGSDGGAGMNTTGGSTTGGTDTGTGTTGTGDGDQTWCDALAVMEDRCQTCHGAELAGGAPMSLVTHADMLAASPIDGRPVHQVVDERIHSADEPMPPVAQGPLSAEELGAMEAWLAAGAPAGPAEGCGGDTGGTNGGEAAAFEWPEECEEFHEIKVDEYTVAADSEERRDFTIPVPWQGEAYALALKPISNNKRVVHHWILYSGSFQMVTSWSPGKEPETFPEGVGIYMPTGGNFRLNMHYYNIGNDQPEVDSSGVEVCITRQPVEHVATTHMFSGPATVPPGGRVENVGECEIQADEPIHLITSSPHMHSYGRAAKFEVVRQDGTVELVHDTPFDWEDQTIKPVDVVVNDGDIVRTTCIYENNTSRTITFGEDSADEMCFNFARYYPRNGFSCGGGLLGGGLPF